MKKTIIIIVVLAVLAGAGYYLYGRNQAKAPAEQFNQTSDSNQTQQSQSEQLESSSTPEMGKLNTKNNSSSPDYTPGKFSNGEDEAAAPDIQVWEVDFDGAQFSPSTITIKAGDYIMFKNKSTQDFWPASDPHPTHTGYPGFDSGKAVAAGAKFNFQFDKVGSWGYHDHLNPIIKGTVIVK
ncbi:MAG: cupredoxin domain-containing protein [Candidatus Doudnabacteria bacterium]|nr:cupredoxin domain-containing protein [Candidatus Doudnabacteria bacterium]